MALSKKTQAVLLYVHNIEHQDLNYLLITYIHCGFLRFTSKGIFYLHAADILRKKK